MSAVSKWFTPASRAASTTSFDASSSIRMPKLLQPRPATDTSRLPTLRNSIARLLGPSARLPARLPGGPRYCRRCSVASGSDTRRIMDEVGGAYRGVRTRVGELVAECDDPFLAIPAPATPEWTVHDLL